MQRQLFALLTIISLCHCVSLDISSSIDYSGQTQSIIQAHFNSSTSYLLSVNGHLDGIRVRDRSGLDINYTQMYSDGRTTISTRVPSDYLEMSFDSDSFTSKNGSSWIYSMELGSSLPISSLSATLLLPDNSTVYSSNGAVSTKDHSLFILWEVSNVSSNKRVLMRSTYEASSSNGINFDFSLLAIPIVLILAIFAYLKFSPKKQITTQPINDSSILENSVFKTLDEVDKQIVLYLSSKGGQTTQADLNLNTHIPKATLSRRVASLESRGIIQKSQKGIRNIVSLTSLVSSSKHDT